MRILMGKYGWVPGWDQIFWKPERSLKNQNDLKFLFSKTIRTRMVSLVLDAIWVQFLKIGAEPSGLVLPTVNRHSS